MEKLNVTVEWCDKNYCAVANDPLGGTIVVTEKNYDDLLVSFKESLDFHIDGLIEDGDSLPEWFANKDFALEFNLLPSAVLRKAQNFTTLAAISRVTGINEGLLYQYANNLKKPRPLQVDKIMNGLRVIGDNIIALA